MSPAAVSRRLTRLESSGVIKGYIALVDDQRIGGLEAFIEIRLVGAIDSDQIDDLAKEIPEISEFYNVAGDPDLLVRLRVPDREELARVVNLLRRTGKVAGTKTLIILDSDAPIVLVQDYHFALAPRLIRERLPRATVIMFWHIPWPNAERFGICPWREHLLRGLLSSSIVGFHTRAHCINFLDAADRYLECRIDHEESSVTVGGAEMSARWKNRAMRPAAPAHRAA